MTRKLKAPQSNLLFCESSNQLCSTPAETKLIGGRIYIETEGVFHLNSALAETKLIISEYLPQKKWNEYLNSALAETKLIGKNFRHGNVSSNLNSALAETKLIKIKLK